jgi:hypothetical protein
MAVWTRKSLTSKEDVTIMGKQKNGTERAFWRATPDDIALTHQNMETYLYVFNLSMDDFLAWVETTPDALERSMKQGTIVDLKRLEAECLNFCKAQAVAPDRHH